MAVISGVVVSKIDFPHCGRAFVVSGEWVFLLYTGDGNKNQLLRGKQYVGQYVSSFISVRFCLFLRSGAPLNREQSPFKRGAPIKKSIRAIKI